MIMLFISVRKYLYHTLKSDDSKNSNIAHNSKMKIRVEKAFTLYNLIMEIYE